MSRVGKQPISIPRGVDVSITDQTVSVKGDKGALTLEVHPHIQVKQENGVLYLSPLCQEGAYWAMCGTMRALVHNMVIGVTVGFEKRLQLIGVGYRAQAQGQKLSLSLGFSHPIEFSVPPGIIVETPSQSEIIVKGSDKQQVGEVAAKIRAYRPPEPYKGKGVRYAEERILMKEAKKK